MIRIYVTKVADGEFVAHCPEVGVVREYFTCNVDSKAQAKGHALVINHLKRSLAELEMQEPE